MSVDTDIFLFHISQFSLFVLFKLAQIFDSLDRKMQTRKYSFIGQCTNCNDLIIKAIIY